MSGSCHCCCGLLFFPLNWLCAIVFPQLVLQSPEEIDKKRILKPDAENKNTKNEPGEDTDVFTQKHSENLFQRTEVLAGGCHMFISCRIRSFLLCFEAKVFTVSAATHIAVRNIGGLLLWALSLPILRYDAVSPLFFLFCNWGTVLLLFSSQYIAALSLASQ